MSYRGRGYTERRGRGSFRGDSYRPSFHRDTGTVRRSRTPEWKRNQNSRDDFSRRNDWNDRHQDMRKPDFRDTRREPEFNRSRVDDRNRNGDHFENDFRHKRKYSGERDPYQANRFERDSNHFEHSSEFPTKRPHFESRGRGRGFRGGTDFRRDELYRERRSFRERNMRSRSYERSRGSSGHRSDRSSERRNISNFISDIRKKSSPRAEMSDSSTHVPTKEELEIESQVIDEKLHESMTLDQRDYVASKALRILVTKPEGRCKLSELEYELMDIKIMFVSSELFLEFLQSFMDDDNVFEIIEPEVEEEDDKQDAEDETKNDKEKDAKDEVKVKVEVKEEPNNSMECEQDKEKDGNIGEGEEGKEGEEEKDGNEEDMENDEVEKESSHLENVIVVGRPKIVFCQKYVANVGSCSRSCGELHLCKFLVLSKCTAPDGKACCFRHTLNSEHNQKALRLNLMHTFSIDHLKTALKNLKFRSPTTLPPICWFYNSNKGCMKWQTTGCTFLHLCENLLKGETCAKDKKCKLNHDILANKDVLTRFGMWSPEYSKEDLLNVISENYIAHESYAKKFPDPPAKESKDDYYTKSGVPKPKWQLFIPSEEMWMDLTETCHRELESKHRAVSRAKKEYEEALEEMKQFKVKTLVGEKRDLPEISNKILRRLEDKTDEEKHESKSSPVKAKKSEKEAEAEEKVTENPSEEVKQESETTET